MLSVPVEQVFELEAVGEALDRSRQFHTRGKLVLRVPQEDSRAIS